MKNPTPRYAASSATLAAKMVIADNLREACGAMQWAGDSCLDWNWLMKQEDFEDTTFIRHIRLSEPFVMKCNGKEEIAVIYENDDKSVKSFKDSCKEIKRN